METETKTIRIRTSTWHKLGIAARQYGTTMQNLASEAIEEHLMHKEAEQREREEAEVDLLMAMDDEQIEREKAEEADG